MDEARRAAAQVAESLPQPLPRFQAEVRWARDYEELLGGMGATTEESAVLREAWNRGRVLLHADGGAGKTTLLHRMFIAAMESAIPILVDLRRWRSRQLREWERHWTESALLLDLVLSSLGSPAMHRGRLAELASDGRVLILVDGLNDIPPAAARSLLKAVDDFAQENPSAAVVVTDRRVRRELPSGRWRLATMQIKEEYIQRSVGPETPLTMRPLLRLAFFLNWAIVSNRPARSISEVFLNYFLEHVRLTEWQLDTASKAALDVYRRNTSRTFKLEEFSELAGADVTDLLINAGTLITQGSDSYFEHHLFHDYLSSRALTFDVALWSREVLDAITLEASSFDVLALALEQMSNGDSADRFLSQIYDWNFYGSAYALAKLESPGGAPVSEEMQVALVTNLAEKRWDTFRITAQRVEDSLRLFLAEAATGPKRSPAAMIAPTTLELATLNQLQALVRRRVFHSERLYEWQRLFVSRPKTKVSDTIVKRIQDPDPLIGWTVSNVLKRAKLSSKQVRDLEGLAASQDPTIRWRAAHSLGSHPHPRSVDVLFKTLQDEDPWVRYGAVRSLIESAALKASLRNIIIHRLIRNLAEIRDEDMEVKNHDGTMLRELARTLNIRRLSSSWVAAVTPLVERLWVTANTVEEQDSWRRLALDLTRSANKAKRVR